MDKEINVKEEYIRLDSALKLAGFVSTGGHAKMAVQYGEVKVNGSVCTELSKRFQPYIDGWDAEENFMPSINVPNEDRKVAGRKKAMEVTLIPEGSMLDDVEKDGDVRRLVHNMMELYEGTTIMNIVVECQREFQEKYFSMGGNDWRHLIRDYVRMVTERPELQETEVFRFVMAG